MNINAIIQLNTKEETLQEIYKICNFSNSKTTKEKTNTETQKTKILFIKLGAIGDVIRTTPLL